MKQAILITAYQDLIKLKDIIEWFDADFDFYIHIDRKCKEPYGFLAQYPNVSIITKYRIQWGSDRHLLAILSLINQVCKSGPYSYVHLITGSDIPIKNIKDFKSFFSEINESNYIEYFSLPHDTWLGEGGLQRIKYYWVGIRWFDARKRYRNIVGKIVKVQRKLHICRDLSFEKKLWGGGTYWSLTGDAVNYLNQKMSDRKYLKHYLHSSVAEELWAQTILLNSSLFSVENNNLRFMKWVGNAASPSVLSKDDYDDICQSDAFFARKIELGTSNLLVEKLIEHNVQ